MHVNINDPPPSKNVSDPDVRYNALRTRLGIFSGTSATFRYNSANYCSNLLGRPT